MPTFLFCRWCDKSLMPNVTHKCEEYEHRLQAPDGDRHGRKGDRMSDIMRKLEDQADENMAYIRHVLQMLNDAVDVLMQKVVHPGDIRRHMHLLEDEGKGVATIASKLLVLKKLNGLPPNFPPLNHVVTWLEQTTKELKE